MDCDPNTLSEAVRCLRCYPINELKKMQVLLACVWGGGVVPSESSFLVQSEDGDYIILDDGGRIIIN